MQGWVKLHRQFLMWQWYHSPVHKNLFLHCLLKANHKDNYHGKTLIKRGSFATSMALLGTELGYNKKTIQRALDDLEDTKELSRKSTRKGSIISITNYDNWQGDVTPMTTRPGAQMSRSLVTNNNDNNENNENNIYKQNLTPDDIVQLWNDVMTKYGYSYAHGLGSGQYLKDFIDARRYLKTIDDWRELFTKVIDVSGNVRDNDGWIINLNWLVNYDNALKIINGNFRRKKSNLEIMQDWAKDSEVFGD